MTVNTSAKNNTQHFQIILQNGNVDGFASFLFGLNGQSNTRKNNAKEKKLFESCHFYHSQNGTSVSLETSHPHSIAQSASFVVACAGLPYHYNHHSRDKATFSNCILHILEEEEENKRAPLFTDQTQLHENDWILETVGTFIKQNQVSGHYGFMVYHKLTGKVMVFNDVFGFMPIFATSMDNGAVSVISTCWETVARSRVNYYHGDAEALALDWDIVAEYLTFGTTLGGISNNVIGTHQHDLFGCRTFAKEIYNLAPGSCWVTSSSCSQNHQLQQCRYTRYYGACELALESLTLLEQNDDDILTVPKNSIGLKDNKTNDEKLHAARGQQPHWSRVNPPTIQTSQQRQPSSLSCCHAAVDDDENYTSIFSCAGVEIENPRAQERRLEKMQQQENNDMKNLSSTNNDIVIQKVFSHFCRAVRQVLDGDSSCTILGSALTGGGDTRLVLWAILLLDKKNLLSELVFQTHGKQSTDMAIAIWIAKQFKLSHNRFTPTSMGRNPKEHIKVILPEEHKLHHERKRNLWNIIIDMMNSTKEEDEEPTHVLQGRFGTEFLGFLCYDKSPIPVQTLDEMETKIIPKASKYFDLMFMEEEPNHQEKEKTRNGKEAISNPIITLDAMTRSLSQTQSLFAKEASSCTQQEQSHPLAPAPPNFDAAYAMQIQLFSRAFLSDIYGGLNGGSWFGMPYSYFTRNTFSPFLDASLLRLLACHVSVEEKAQPYKWYGELYRQCVPDLFRQIPCNNKSLCMHAGIPRALKAPEKMAPSSSSPCQPEVCNAKFGKLSSWWIKDQLKKCKVYDKIRQNFRPVFWDGALMIIALGETSKVDAKVLAADSRPQVQALVNEIGANDAILLSKRLSSFLLWFEHRFLPIILAYQADD